VKITKADTSTNPDGLPPHPD